MEKLLITNVKNKINECKKKQKIKVKVKVKVKITYKYNLITSNWFVKNKFIKF